MTNWPARTKGIPHRAPVWSNPTIPRFRPAIALGRPGVFTTGAYLLREVLIESSAHHPGEYYVKRDSKVVVFSSSYENQTLITSGRYTLVGSQMSEACNWVVCNSKGSIGGIIDTLPPTICVGLIQAALFQKVSVLRTDYTSELSHGDLCAEQNAPYCVFV